jgi:hypothetical protein
MLADFEYRFNDHEDTIRRAEAIARLHAALDETRTDAPPERRRRGISLILRRLAGTAVTAA